MRLVYFVIGVILLTTVIYAISFYVSFGLVSLLPISPRFPLYESFPRVLSTVVLFFICIPLVDINKLSIPKHILIALTFGSLALALLILFRRVQNPNKVYIFNTMAMILGFTTTVAWIIDIYFNIFDKFI